MPKITLDTLRAKYPVFQGEPKLLKINIHKNICADLKCQPEDLNEVLAAYVQSAAYQKLDKKGPRYNLNGSVYKRTRIPTTWEECLKKWQSDPTVPYASVAKQVMDFAYFHKLPQLKELIPPEVKAIMEKKLNEERKVRKEARKERRKEKREEQKKKPR